MSLLNRSERKGYLQLIEGQFLLKYSGYHPYLLPEELVTE
jgi:hypothetical protein